MLTLDFSLSFAVMISDCVRRCSGRLSRTVRLGLAKEVLAVTKGGRARVWRSSSNGTRPFALNGWPVVCRVSKPGRRRGRNASPRSAMIEFTQVEQICGPGKGSYRIAEPDLMEGHPSPPLSPSLKGLQQARPNDGRRSIAHLRKGLLCGLCRVRFESAETMKRVRLRN